MIAMSQWLRDTLGCRVRKIAVNAGTGCPNRDGTIGTGGCIYCNNASFNPAYANLSRESVTSQIEAGIRFSSNKGDADAFLVYFQSYTNTYGDTGRLTSMYREALSYPKVRGLVIATRPDCLPAALLDWFQDYVSNGGFLLVELGVESTIDRTLQSINRGHDWACARNAIQELYRRGIFVGAHLILGLPGETRDEMLSHADVLSALPITTLKLHQLQIIRNTPLAERYLKDPVSVPVFTARDYAALARDFIKRMRPDTVLDRVVSEAPKSMLLAPDWGLKPSEFMSLLGDWQ